MRCPSWASGSQLLGLKASWACRRPGWQRSDRKEMGTGLSCRAGGRQWPLSLQWGRDAVQLGGGTRPSLRPGCPVPTVRLHSPDGGPTHSGALPAPRCHHRHCQGGRSDGLRGQVGAFSFPQNSTAFPAPTDGGQWASCGGPALWSSLAPCAVCAGFCALLSA